MGSAALSSAIDTEPASRPGPVLRCVQGDAGAWRQLHRQYQPIAAAFLRKLGVLEPDLEDACQEVFVQMFRYLGTFRGEASLKTWLYRLCITQARRVRSRRRLRGALDRWLARVPAETLVSAPTFCEDAARRRIDAALSQFSEADRSMLVLFEMEGLPGEQVAEIVGCTLPTLWRRLHHARAKFREALVGAPEGT